MQLAGVLLLISFRTIYAENTKLVLTTLYSFSGADGAFPASQLIKGPDANFYGITRYGGTTNQFLRDGGGTVFRMTRSGILQTLYSFGTVWDSNRGVARDGSFPNSLILGIEGNFYGSTAGGGFCTACDFAVPGTGTIFKLTPSGIITTLLAFDGFAQGRGPTASLLAVNNGYFYGATSRAGWFADFLPGAGTLFLLHERGDFTHLYTFGQTYSPITRSFGADGEYPAGALVQEKDGTIYGVTASGGAHNCGTIFRFAQSIVTTIYSFGRSFDTNSNLALDGKSPNNLIISSSGSIYGTTQRGGALDAGTAFRLALDGTPIILHSFGTVTNEFGDPVDGRNPNSLVLSPDGSLYGTTEKGGQYAHLDLFNEGYGVLFQLSTNGALNVIYSFGTIQDADGVPLDGRLPNSLSVEREGLLYGTTGLGGSLHSGTVFRVEALREPPLILEITHNGNALVLTFRSIPARKYQIQYKAGLTQSTWTNFESAITASAGTTIASADPTVEHQRFYRVMLLP
jgi:uncharacterized repeat protein (TIGR03803 family)